MRTETSETAEAIGWHLHGRTWVWGIASGEGCQLCDDADRWLDSIIRSRKPGLQEQLMSALRARNQSSNDNDKTLAPASKSRSRKEEMQRRQVKLF